MRGVDRSACRTLIYTFDLAVLGAVFQKGIFTNNDGLAYTLPSGPDRRKSLRLHYEVAAVIGETFSLNVLEKVFPLDLDETVLKKHLSLLVDANFLMLSVAGEDCYKFTHSLVRTCFAWRKVWSQGGRRVGEISGLGLFFFVPRGLTFETFAKILLATINSYGTTLSPSAVSRFNCRLEV